jgi:hypothetical protein
MYSLNIISYTCVKFYEVAVTKIYSNTVILKAPYKIKKYKLTSTDRPCETYLIKGTFFTRFSLFLADDPRDLYIYSYAFELEPCIIQQQSTQNWYLFPKQIIPHFKILWKKSFDFKIKQNKTIWHLDNP